MPLATCWVGTRSQRYVSLKPVVLLAGQKRVDGAAVRVWQTPYVAAPGLVGAVVESPGVRPALGKDDGVIRSVRGEAALARMAGASYRCWSLWGCRCSW